MRELREEGGKYLLPQACAKSGTRGLVETGHPVSPFGSSDPFLRRQNSTAHAERRRRDVFHTISNACQSRTMRKTYMRRSRVGVDSSLQPQDDGPTSKAAAYGLFERVPGIQMRTFSM